MNEKTNSVAVTEWFPLSPSSALLHSLFYGNNHEYMCQMKRTSHSQLCAGSQYGASLLINELCLMVVFIDFGPRNNPKRLETFPWQVALNHVVLI